ncbi:MAG TPA: hypothetical protein VFA20_00845 [Myxococcaceae bacterium]|nr:hypothetical protein [Myxococcaceae bacterium]
MIIQSANAGLPNCSPLSSTPNAASRPPSGGTGYPTADTFQAAPQPAGLQQQFQVLTKQVDAVAQTVQQIKADFGVGAAKPAGAPNLGNVTGDPRLLQATQQIARDPAGAKLEQAAQAPGLKLQIGNLPPGVMGVTQNGTITINSQAVNNKPDLIHTLAHELGHAATPKDGDSIAEEQAVDQLGQQIQQRIAPGPTFHLDLGAYQGQGLPQDNGIRSSLAKIGL